MKRDQPCSSNRCSAAVVDGRAWFFVPFVGALWFAAACVPLHDESLPDTSLGPKGSDDRLRLLVDRDHRRTAQVVPVVIEAQRKAVTENPHCVAIIGFPGRLDLPLGSDCPPAAASDAGSETRVCMDLRQLGTDGPFEGTRIAAYHPAKAAETFTAFAQLHGNSSCAGSPVAEVAVVVELGSGPAAQPTPDASSPDAGPPPDGGPEPKDAAPDSGDTAPDSAPSDDGGASATP